MRNLILMALILTVCSGDPLEAASFSQPFHLDRQKLPYGCGSCHVGFNFRSGGGGEGCFNCHGNPGRRRKGLVRPGIELKDIEVELKKTYRHPILETRGIHSSKERLPETDPKSPRHVDCVDCHSPHLVAPENRLAGIKGKKLGNPITDITKEYELCYRCHADSANLPGRSVNKRLEFAASNPSFHPVEQEGKNLAVVSLIKPYREKRVTQNDVSMILCADCHGSDNPSAPKGPHSSAFQYILKDNYSTRDNEQESSFLYALCYRCHNRSSILGDESFKFHSIHIKGKQGYGVKYSGTSCHTCHSSHGSTENKYLIRFNTEVVSTSSGGMLKYKEKGSGAFRGECYLTCHGVDHNPKSY
jgi:hypothetical protein